MLLFALFTLAAVAKSQLYLTSTDDNQVQSSTSQALSYLSTGKEMYALANLQAYSVLFWLQLHSPSSSYTPILSLTTQGKEARGVDEEWGDQGTVLQCMWRVCAFESSWSSAGLQVGACGRGSE